MGVSLPYPAATSERVTSWRTVPIVRTVLAGLFVLLMLGAAHLSMVVVNAIEMRVEHPTPAEGLSARMFTDLPLTDELEAALKKSRVPADQQVLRAALADARAGRSVPLRTLPVTPALVWSTLLLTGAGLLLLWGTTRLRSDAAQTIAGVFAGNLLWTGGVEYGLTIASRSLGVAKSVAVVDGQLAGVYGEYVLLKDTWGLMVLVVAYLLMQESSRCPLSIWWRQFFVRAKVAAGTGRIENYGSRSAVQYATTVWGFYLLLLWAYDETVFGVHGLFTSLVMFGALSGSLYVLWRLHQYRGWGPAIRYAIGAMIVAWTPLEIAGKWNLFTQPWLLLQSSSFLVFFGGLAVGTLLLVRAQRRAIVTHGLS
jgi:hypothetical protein